MRLVTYAVAILLVPAIAHAQPPPPPAASARPYPDTWLRYAEFLQYALGQLIETSTDPAAQRLRAIIATPGAVDRGGLVVRVWVDGTGKVTRVTTPPRPTSTVEQDLTSLLVGHVLDEAPPVSLPWPAALAFTAKATAAPEAAGPSPLSSDAQSGSVRKE